MPQKKKPTPKKKSTPAGRRPGGSKAAPLRCPDCDFVAKHAMGLGRHRSARHGVLSQRAKRMTRPRATAPKIPEGWLTRRDAAARAGVHYNTVRIWERSGKVRTSSLGNQTLISEEDFLSLVSDRGTVRRAPSGPSPETLQQLADLNDRFHELADALEGLARQIRPRRRRSRAEG